jgi:hypothetical protein
MPAIVKPAFISWTEVFKRTWKEANEDDVLGRSAQLAYYFFSSVVSCFLTGTAPRTDRWARSLFFYFGFTCRVLRYCSVWRLIQSSKTLRQRKVSQTQS